jgi:O-Antigen ligase
MASTSSITRPQRPRTDKTAEPRLRAKDHKLALPVKLYFLAVALPVYFHAGPLLMTGVRAVLMVMMIPMCINLLSGKYGRILLTDFLFFLFSLWIVITLFINSPASALSFGGSVAIEFFGGYLLSRAYIRSAQDMAAMCRILFFLVLFTIPFALYEGQTGRAFIPELIRKIPGLNSVEDFYNELAGRRLGLERVQVIFAHPIHYGLFCSTAFSLTVIGLQRTFTNTQRYIAGFFICFAAFLSLSSGAILPILLQFSFILWATVMRRVKSKWLILIGIIAVFYVIIDLISSRTPIDVFMSYATFSPGNAFWRQSIFEWGMKNVWANPFVGIGLNDWFRPWWMFIDSVDNFWLLSAMRYGITGFLMLAIGFFMPIWTIAWRKIDEASPAWPFRRAWVITFIGLTLTLSTVDVWATMFAHVAFLFGSGMWFLTTNLEIASTETTTPPVQTKAKGVVYTRFPHQKNG